MLSSLVLALAVSSVLAQRGQEPICQPRIYASPSGEVELFVDPTTRQGAGPARYRLTREGRELWAGEKPFTLWRAVVADDGRVGGYAYSSGLSGWEGSFLVVVLSAEGELLLEDVHERVDTRVLHGDSGPVAQGIFLDPPGEGFVVRIADSDPNRGIEEWWCYSFEDPASEDSTRRAAERRSVVRPEAFHDLEGDGSRRIQDACALQGVPLRLVWWWRFSYDEELDRAHVGASFSLVDLDGDEVWSMDLLDDYSVPDDQAERDVLQRRVRELGALLEVGPEGRFSVWCVERGVRLDLRARPGDERGTWMVETLGERGWDPHPRETDLDPPPAVELTPLGSVALGGEAAEEGIGPVHAFGFDATGKLRLWRWKSPEAGELVVLEPNGAVVSSAPVDLSDLQGLQVDCWPLADQRWLLTAGEWGGGERCRVAIVDERTGERVTASEWREASFQAVCARPDGGFVALVSWSGSGKTLFAVDRELRVLWRVEEGYPDPAKLFSPEGVAVTARGHVAVSDVIRDTLQLFDADGSFLETLDLAKLLPAPPAYPSELETDPTGGLLLIDPQGPNHLVRLGEHGEVRAALSVAPPEGIPLGRLPYRVRVAPDGALWTTDGNALLRLDEEGAVDEVVGRLPSPDHLGRPGATCIDHLGRVLIQDTKTGVLHAFDVSGARLFAARPDPGDFENISGIERLSVEPDGTVHVPSDAHDGRTVRFSADGRRRGFGRERPGPFLGGEPDAFAADGSHWEELDFGFLGYALRHVVDGHAVAQVLRTAADRWFDHGGVQAFAADAGGGLVVLHEGREPERDDGLSFYDADGTPRRMVGLRAWRLAVDERWAVAWPIGHEAQLVRRSDGTVRTFVAPVADGNGCTFGFSPDGSELWVVETDGEHATLHRFALP